MKLIRSGGVNSTLNKDDPNYNKFGFGNYFMVQIKSELESLTRQGKTIAVCVAAKPDKNHYNDRFIDMGFNPEDLTIIGSSEDADWDQYDAVLLLGGQTKDLYAWLQKTKFSIDRLKKCQILCGDSAGAYVLSGKTLVDYTSDGKFFEIVDGFIPKINQLIAAHVNNSHYHKASLGKVLDEWCKTNSVEYIELVENELNISEI